jgi:hypothetical protein
MMMNVRFFEKMIHTCTSVFYTVCAPAAKVNSSSVRRRNPKRTSVCAETECVNTTPVQPHELRHSETGPDSECDETIRATGTLPFHALLVFVHSCDCCSQLARELALLQWQDWNIYILVGKQTGIFTLWSASRLEYLHCGR